ncbi:DUF6531 domain-containing protein [Mycetocola sp. JXN-3]|uniref:DUF6531 domain-containing protein n=1 Tax=Mycetocola sp. JXN-3 TaxID=2116510 RepID=UPI00165D043E|nr:DUF6531 domain-containing protein [Mycetocola sp. JXN-3]
MVSEKELGVFSKDVTFDFGTADALIGAFNAAASQVSGQGGSRGSLVATAGTEFRGVFAELFQQNARTASTDRENLAARLREVADGARQLSDAARRENQRRRAAREWKKRVETRRARFIDSAWDFFAGEEAPPVGRPEAPVQISRSSSGNGNRETPAPGSGGGGSGGLTAARPSDLRTFATGSANLNADLAGKPGSLRSHLADFAARCTHGRLSADGVVTGFERWLAANDQDVAWATTIANAFAAAGGEGNISRLADSALLAALSSAGVAAQREGIVIEPAQAFGVPPTTGFTNDPVNTSTGNFLETEIDLGFIGASASLVASRTYNSLDLGAGAFGPGWGSIFDTRLDLGDEGASIVLPDGRTQNFPRLGDGWDRAVAENAWLTREAPGTAWLAGDDAEVLVVRDNAGSRWIFSPGGAWLGQDAGPGTAVRTRRDSENRITEVEHERGRSFRVEWSDQKVVVLAASDGRRVEFGYAESGELISAQGPGGTRRYRWNEDGILDAVFDAAGLCEVENTYDSSRRVASQISPFGRVTRFAYLPGRITVVSDEDGTRSNTWIADSLGRLVGVIDAHDARQSMAFDRNGNLVSATGRDGQVTVHGYDARGRRTRTVTPQGTDLTFGYDEFDRVTTVVTESGGTVTYEYAGDAERNPALVIDPEGGRTELEWQGASLRRITDPEGVVVTFGYDEFGDLISTTNAMGNVARIERDQSGRMIAGISPGGAKTSVRYDAAGNVIARQDPDGGITRFEYGPGGALSAVTDPLGARTEIEAGPHGQSARVIDALGRATLRHFDDLGNVAGLELPGGLRWSFVHDELSRLTTITDPSGESWRREYSMTGELSALVDPTGVRREISTDLATSTVSVRDAFDHSSVRYDGFGRPVAAEGADGSTDLVTYDLCGRPIELVDADGGLTLLRRDAAGRVIEQVTPLGATSRFEYDAAGRAVSMVDPAGARTRLEYDADSRLSARVLPGGDVERFEYDSSGRLIRHTVPGRGQTRIGYDRAGRVVRVSDGWHGSRRFRYDPVGQLVSVVNGVGAETRFEYDDAGRVVATIDPLGGVVRHEYTPTGQVSAVTDQLGRRSSAGYDAAGRQLWQEDPDGRRTSWGYDAAGRQDSLSVDGRVVMRSERDASARTVTITDLTAGEAASVTHRLERNRLGLLVSRTRDGVGISWEYDADGRRVAMVAPDGARTEYRYDAAGRVSAVSHPVFGVITYERDAAGHLLRAVSAGVTQEWELSAGTIVGHRTQTVTPGTGESEDSVDVATTRVGRDENGRILWVGTDTEVSRYEYDGAGQLTSVRTEGSVEATGVSSVSWSFDAVGRLVSETRVSGAEPGGVPAAGTETVVPSVVFAYDAAGQLLSRSVAAHANVSGVDAPGVTRFSYDGLGRRVRQVGPDGGARLWLWSELGSLAGVRDVRPDGSGIETVLSVDVLGELSGLGVRRFQADDNAGAAGARAAVDGSTADAGFGGDPVGAGAHGVDPSAGAVGAGVPLAGCAVDVPVWWDSAAGWPVLVQVGSVPVGVFPGGISRVGIVGSADAGLAGSPSVGSSAVGSPGFDSSPVGGASMGSASAGLSSAGLSSAGLSSGGVLPGGGWRGVRGSVASDPWMVVPGVDLSGLSAGSAGAGVAELDALFGAAGVGAGLFGVTGSGGLMVSGAEWMGARVYDPASFGFVSTDPLPGVLGTGWLGNGYAFVGNDPLHAVDPWGLRPVTDAELQAYASAHNGAIAKAGEWIGDNWEYIVGGVAIVAGVALMFTGVGGPIGVALIGAASGALLSGGISVVSQKAQNGSVDWGQVGVQAVIGAATGGAGGAISAGRAGVSVAANAGRNVVSSARSVVSSGAGFVSSVGGKIGTYVTSVATRQTAIDMGLNAGVGGVGNLATYLVSPGNKDIGGAFAALSSGVVSGGLTSLAGPLADPIKAELGRKITQSVLAAGGNVGGSVMEKSLTGQGYDGFDLFWDASIGAGTTHLPDANKLSQGAPSKADVAGMLGMGQVVDWAGEGLHMVYDNFLGK